MQPVLASKKLLQRKIQSPQPDGVKKEETTKVEHNHMPTNPSQCSRNTKQHSKRYMFHIPNRHTPTNKPPKGSLADKPINTQPCTQKIKSTLAHYWVLKHLHHTITTHYGVQLIVSKKNFVLSVPVFLSPLQPGTFLFLWGAVGRADSY